MQINAENPESYISQLPDERKQVIEKMRKTILDNLPKGFEEAISYGMIGYVVPHSVYPNGYHTNPKLPLPFINIASQKNFVALYHMGIYADEKLMEWFKAEYPKHCKTKLDMGKSCLRFKKIDQIPYVLIGELIGKMSSEKWIEIYEKNIKKKFKTEIKWAVIFSTMMILWMLLERLVGLHDVHIDKHTTYTNLVVIPAVVIYVLALLDKRKNDLQGFMTYKQGFLAGLIITTVVTLLTPLMQFITSTVITPDYFANVIEFVVKDGKMTQQQAEDYFNLQNYVVQGLMGAPIMGIFTTAIVAIFTRKN